MRAYYLHDFERIYQFGMVLTTGYAQGETDEAAVTLRNWLMNLTRIGTGWSLQQELYERTETALKAFLEFRPLRRINRAQKELFPFPS